MRLTLDNLDGLGAVDYSNAIDRSEPIEIARTLNAPSTARGLLTLVGAALKAPLRRARIVLTSDGGTLLFTGYLTTEPVPLYAGAATEGPVYRLAFRALSDEWLLDKAAGTAAAGALGQPADEALLDLVATLAPGVFTTNGVAPCQKLGVLAPAGGAAFSGQVGAAANSSYSAYRVINGDFKLTQAGSVTHTFADSDGSLALAALRTSSVKELANDVTVTGAEEPAAYWQEFFLGDGATGVFPLTGEPAAPASGHAVLVSDDFSGSTLNRQTWNASDPGSHLSLGAAGFTMNGGNGFDGQTFLAANAAIELGGTLMLELGNVQLNGASAGVLAGLYGGAVTQVNCFAGFNVRQSGGNTVVTAMVDGVEAGTTFPLIANQPYTLRVRLHCPELLRQKQAFYAMVDVAGTSQLQLFGVGVVDAPMQLTFEIRNLAEASNAVATVLYDGSVTTSYAIAKFCAFDSIQLFGSVGSVNVTRTGTAFVQASDPTTGATTTRLIGTHLEGAEASITAGNVTFFAGAIPVANSLIKVAYRGRSRAVARLADAASLAAEAAGGGTGTSRWLGKVISPPARCSEDCENAAQAILAFATDRAAALSGSYLAVNPVSTDIWPGDVLSFSANGETTSVLVRKVVVVEQGAAPEVLTFRIDFANDWAEGLGLQLSESYAVDASIPDMPLELLPGKTPATSGHVLANLNQVKVIAFTGSDMTAGMTVDAGTDPPPGGGFEIRRRDGGFGTLALGSAAGDLVLRSPVRGLSIPRVAFEERFFIRMYDANGHYSRQSAAIVTHMPVETA